VTAPGPEVPLPEGWSIDLDRRARRTDGGRTLVGGAPLRVVRLTAAGARWLDGDRVPRSPGQHALARRLLDAGLAHPRPTPPAAIPSVAAVVPIHDDAAGLAVTRPHLAEADEVVVVDDGSPAPVPDATLRHPEPLGPGRARDAGWTATTAELVAFVDADVTLPAGWLAALAAHLADPRVGAVAPRVVARPGAAPDWLGRYEAVRSPLDLGPDPALVRPGSPVPYVPTTVLLVRRSALQAVGGFDPDLRYGEDVDLVWRLAEAGWQVRYEPAVVATHPCRPTLRAWAGQRVAYGSSAAPLAVRHGDALAPLGTSPWSALAWGAVLAGHPVVGAAVAGSTTAALVPKLEGMDRPGAEALRIAGLGHLWAGRAVADALRRPWWPLAALLAWRVPRTRPALAAAVVVPALLEHRERRPRLDPLRWSALRLADDLAYGAGVWRGCWRARSLRPLVPALAGRIRGLGASARGGAGDGDR